MYKNGKVSSVLAPGKRQIYWRGPVEVRVEKQGISVALELPKGLAALLISVVESGSEPHALVFYPHADHEKCTAALLLDIDPVGLVRSHGAKPADAGLDEYVNDRPYVASSFMSVAIGLAFCSCSARCFGAISGHGLPYRGPAFA